VTEAGYCPCPAAGMIDAARIFAYIAVAVPADTKRSILLSDAMKA